MQVSDAPIFVGDNCTIHPYVAIGLDGFSIYRDQDGTPHQYKHEGGVAIGANVRIGSFTNIARATLKGHYTTIYDDVMIDSLVHIAHNAVIGKGTIIVSHANIGGSVHIGSNCFIGMSATIMQHIKIGNNVIVGAGAVVNKDIADGDIVVGVPARTIKGNTTLTADERFRMVGY